MSASSTRGAGGPSVAGRRPNIVFVMADDHAAHASEAGDVEPDADPRRSAATATKELR